MEWTGVNARMHVAPRSVVQLHVDGAARFYGIVPDPPSAGNPDVEQVLALGGKEALRLVLLDGKVYRGMGVYAIVRDILARLCPPSLTYNAAAIGGGDGPGLDLYYAPTSDLVTVLDALAKSAGVEWWVDATGTVNFRPPSPDVLGIDAIQSSRYLQVQGRETVSRAVLRIISAPSVDPVSASTYVDALDTRRLYLPATLTTVATAAEHSLYYAERSVEAQTGVSLFQDSRAGQLSGNDLADISAAVDGNRDSAATSGGPRPQIRLAEAGKRVVGLRLRYAFSPPDGVTGMVHLSHTGAGLGDDLFWPLPASSEAREALWLAPPSAEVSADWTQSAAEVYTLGDPPQEDLDGNPDTPTTPAPVRLTLYDLALLTVDEATATRTAQGFLHTPSANPAEVSLGGLVEPVPQVSVGGIGGTGPAPLWEYEHSRETVRTTRVRLGSDGQAGTARAIKFAVQAGA